MPGRSGILSPRHGPGGLDDLAERASLIARQRVRGRRTRRALERASRRARWLALAAVLILSQVALVHWLATSPRFAITHVEIAGLSQLSDAEVRAAAGIEAGQNLFRLDPEAVALRLQRLPRVRRVDVIRSLPNRVTLLVEERRPFALAVSGGRLYWLDEEGTVLGPELRAVTPELPVLTGFGRSGSGDGTPSAERSRAAVALLRTLLRTAGSLAETVSEIDAGRPDGPVLYTVDGIEVRLGPEAWEERLGRLEGVLAQLQAEGEAVESIDLRFRDQVVMKAKR